jgi:hypothetical protein
MIVFGANDSVAHREAVYRYSSKVWRRLEEAAPRSEVDAFCRAIDAWYAWVAAHPI